MIMPKFLPNAKQIIKKSWSARASVVAGLIASFGGSMLAFEKIYPGMVPHATAIAGYSAAAAGFISIVISPLLRGVQQAFFPDGAADEDPPPSDSSAPSESAAAPADASIPTNSTSGE